MVKKSTGVVSSIEGQANDVAAENASKIEAKADTINKNAKALEKKDDEDDHPILAEARKEYPGISWNVRTDVKDDLEETEELSLEGNIKTWTNAIQIDGEDSPSDAVLIKRVAKVLLDRKHSGAANGR